MFHFLKRWLYEEEALAATEAAMIFPIMCTLLLGVFDVGNAILTNQKTIRASQVVADIIARQSSVSTSDINEAVEAGRLAFEPLSSASYGIDVVSVEFDQNENMNIVWRETRNMTAIPNVSERVSPLAAEGEGVVMVAVQYTFEPIFAKFIAEHVNMQEVAFSRGRKSAVVSQQ